MFMAYRCSSLVLALVFWSLTCFGQAFTPRRPFIPAASSSQEIPQQLPVLRFWWVASDLSNSPVSVWTDRVHGEQLVQATAANQPLWQTNVGVKFFGTNWMYFTHPVTMMTNTSWAVAVTTDTSSAASRNLLSFTDQNSVYLQRNWAGKWRALKIDTGPTAVNGAKFYAMITHSNSLVPARSYYYTNGTMYGSGAQAENSTLLYTFTNMFRNQVAPTEPYYGTVMELLCWTNELVFPFSAAQVSNVFFYLTNKYGAP